MLYFCFFFSSRRRHTRYWRDWSSDVCSSDLAHDHADPCVAIIKHANPCGIAVGTDIAAAHRKAHACDPVSAFGGVIAANREVDLTMAEQVAEVFTEVVVAPSFTEDALQVLTAKKNIRLLRLGEE